MSYSARVATRIIRKMILLVPAVLGDFEKRLDDGHAGVVDQPVYGTDFQHFLVRGIPVGHVAPYPLDVRRRLADVFVLFHRVNERPQVRQSGRDFFSHTCAHTNGQSWFFHRFVRQIVIIMVAVVVVGVVSGDVPKCSRTCPKYWTSMERSKSDVLRVEKLRSVSLMNA